MPAQKFDRVKETTNTQGTGPYTLDGAVTGFQAFSDVYADGTSGIRYLVTDNVSWEIVEGTFTAALNQLSRDTILASSASGAAINWPAGTKTVALVQTASEILQKGGQPGNVTIGSTDGTTTIRGGGTASIDVPATGPVAVKNSQLLLDNNIIIEGLSGDIKLYRSDLTGDRFEFSSAQQRATVRSSSGSTLGLSAEVSADPYTLDQVVKGTWTPSLGRYSTQPSINYNARVGNYMKIGAWVICNFYISISSVNNQGDGFWYITGIPYNPVGNEGESAGVIGESTAFDIAFDRMMTNANNNRIELIADGDRVKLNKGVLQNGGNLTGQITYRVE